MTTNSDREFPQPRVTMPHDGLEPSRRVVREMALVFGRLRMLILAVGLGLSTFSYAARAAPAGGTGTVPNLYDALLSTMKNGGALGESGRFAQLAPVIRSNFDVARLSMVSNRRVSTGSSRL